MPEKLREMSLYRGESINHSGRSNFIFFVFVAGVRFFVSPLHPARSFLLLLFFPRPRFLPFFESFHSSSLDHQSR
jgi:hypothetical protein